MAMTKKAWLTTLTDGSWPGYFRIEAWGELLDKG